MPDGGLPSWTGFPGLKITGDPRAAAIGVHRVPIIDEPGLSRSPVRINSGGNSGYQAINLAYLLGARRIALIGYDMQHTAGRRHFFGDHPAGMNNAEPVSRWVAPFAQLAADLADAGVQVSNCSRATALDCFNKESISSWIA